MKFFEAPPVLLPGASRDYSQNFSGSETRYIYWELSLTHPPPGEQQALEITAVYTRSGGTVFTEHTYSTIILGSAVSSTHIKGSGFSDPGQWSADTYRVDLSVEGILVASETFQITG
ncbi:MAG: hypothetical protein J4N33_00985 [Chloroflexi bacterium]|nr:hypothetical protein [Chloroflexota bacterium]